MVSGIVFATLLTFILLSAFIVHSGGVGASLPEMLKDAAKTIESSNSGDFLDAELGDSACMDKNSAELVVGIRENCFSQMRNLITGCRSKLASTVSMGGEVEAVVCDVPSETVPGFVADARSEGLSRYIEPNVQFHINSFPDDPYKSLQWALDEIQAYSAWNITTGNQHTLVAIVDTGVDYDHPDLAQNYVALGYDWVNNDTDPMDDNGHGTHCAGIIAAGLDNGVGVAGVAQVRFFAEKGFDQYGSGWSDDLANAICHAVNQGAKIISCSWGSSESSELIHAAMRYAYEHGVLVIASAGNDAWDLKSYPAAYEEVVAVAATDGSDSPTGFTNYGDWIKLSAPGDYIFSTVPNSGYSYMSGTSMSAPYVAGVAALVWSQFPNMTRDQVLEQLFKTSDDLGPTGFDVHYGYGRVNARRAVQEALPKIDVLILGCKKRATIYCRPGIPLTVNATIFGFGTSDESNVTSQLLINGSVVDTWRADSLRSGESEAAHFQWTPSLEGTYNVTVYVVPVSGENATDNNALTMNVNVRAPRIIEVRQDSFVQNAVDSAYPGDILKVDAGTYYEHLTIDKSLSLVAVGTTVIDGNGTGTVVHVLADNVSVTGFNVQNGNRGICLDCSDRSTIDSNTISNNSEGLVLLYSGNNKITNNSMIDNECNFCVEGDFDQYTESQFVQDMDSSNTVDRRPVYYWVNQHDKQIPSDAGYVAIINSTNIAVKDLSLTRNSQGILIAYTEGSVVENVDTSKDGQGILLVGSFNCTVQSNSVANDDCGIDLRGSFNVTVAQNTVLNNTDGLSLIYSSDNILQSNTITSNHNNGIGLEYSTSNEIRNNNVSNSFRGLNLACSGNGILRDNNLINNTNNFGIDGECLQDFIHDIDTSNTVEGKPIYYLVNRQNLFLDPSASPNPGYLAVVNCTGITVEDLNLTSNSQGILLSYTNNSTIEKVNASNNSNGICLFNCNENTIRENLMTNSARNGITLHSSTNNDIALNTVAASGECGIYLDSSSNNSIRNNTFSESRWGSGIAPEESSRYNSFTQNTVERNLIGLSMGINEPHDNKIYYNNFVHNTNQVLDWTGFWIKMNTWDDGKGQGNYWSDYRGEDSNGDGIGDTPHLGIDNFPLMIKYWNQADINHDGKVDILDVAIVAKAYGSKKGDPNWKGKADLDNNGITNIIDLSLVAIEYGKAL
jgi:thermitase